MVREWEGVAAALWCAKFGSPGSNGIGWDGFRFGYFKYRRPKLDTYVQVAAGHEEASASLENSISSGIFENNDSGPFPKQAHKPSTAYHYSHPSAPKKPYIVTYPRDQQLLTLEDHLELLCLEMHEFMLTMFDTGAYMTFPLSPTTTSTGRTAQPKDWS